MTTIRDANRGPVALVSCRANANRYTCYVPKTVAEVRLHRLPEMGRRDGTTDLERAIWRGLCTAGYGNAYALTPCPCGHQREVIEWLTDHPV